ncbi:SET domain-containing protein [Trametes sanguinea]|nr:SET domain-containing protein [Trametes sanguinea]
MPSSPTVSAHVPPPEEDALHVQQRRYAERRQEEQRLADTIRDTYRDAWAEFYKQENLQCTQLIQALASASPSHPPALYGFLSAGGDSEELEKTVNESPPDMTVDIWDCERSRLSVRALRDDLELSSVASYAYPKYESCTPSSQSVLHNGDPLLMAYVPYADESDFQNNIEPLARHYSRFAWQDEWYDVDFKIIAAEILRRLQIGGLDDETIEMFKPPSLPSAPSLFTSLRKRDLPGWAGDELLARVQEPRPPPGLFSEVDRMASFFCGSLSCNTMLCLRHHDPTQSPPSLSRELPRSTNLQLYKQVDNKKMCKNDCFVDYELGEYNELLLQNQDITDILLLFPNIKPCSLAPIVKAKCCDVFHHRMYIFPDQRREPLQPARLDSRQGAHEDMRRDFCTHSGPCSLAVCICVQSQLHCERRCKCSTACHQRHRGCDCPKGGCRFPDNLCTDPEGQCTHLQGQCTLREDICPCLDTGFECDPEHCAGHSKKRSLGKQKHCCSNMQSQLEHVQSLSVKIGSWGLGTFAQGHIDKGAFVGEYGAELILSPENAHQGDHLEDIHQTVNTYRGLNYMFNLSGTDHILDAATIGDYTRYINDPMDESKANVTANTIAVGGDTKVLFRTVKKVKPGEELLLHYGEAYWASHNS